MFSLTHPSSSWNLASPMSQIRKLTAKLQIHLKVLAFWRAFSPSIDNAVLNNQAPRNRPLNPNLGLWPPLQPDTYQTLTSSDKSCWAKCLCLAFSPFPSPSYSPKESVAACKVVTTISSVSSHQQPVTISLTYMVKSPAALSPCCKTISPWEAIECFLSKV